MFEQLPSEAASFALRFKPSPKRITVVRQFVENLYANILDDPDSSSRVALATHELLENSTKYSIDGEVQLWVQIDFQHGRVIVRTTNRAAQFQIDRLRACFHEIMNAPNVRDYYSEMLRRSAQRQSGSGGLGLARIWAESDMSIRLVVHGDEVEIHAEGPIVT